MVETKPTRVETTEGLVVFSSAYTLTVLCFGNLVVIDMHYPDCVE